MAPIERFPSKNSAGVGEYYSHDRIAKAVETILEKRGIGILDFYEAEVSQTLEQYRVWLVGTSESEAWPIVLIGNVGSGVHGEEDWVDTDDTDHNLIVPPEHREVIDEVKAELVKQPQQVS